MARSAFLAILLTITLVLFPTASHALQITGVSAGVNAATGARPFRYEISQFAKSGPAFDLYILALLSFQSVDQDDELSYYQIAGIHGYPHLPWDGVVGNQTLPGYCTHNAANFPSWHRPYLALFEQTLWTHAQAIAQSYPLPQLDTYTAAAGTLRIPYWDWAANPALPDVVTTTTITVNGPNGTALVNNPLYQFTFLDGPPENDFQGLSPFASFPYTVRHWNSTYGHSIQANATAALLANAPGILSLVYQMFSVSDYNAFATTGPPDPSAFNIENIHNGIHAMVGGDDQFPGHMQNLAVSSFDPIFWLHHANVDRYFAMWQALHSDSYIQPTVTPWGTYTDPPNASVSGSTGLSPFHSDTGVTLFTSDGVRATGIFGYTYPELVDWNATADQLATYVQGQVNSLYNTKVSSQTGDSVATFTKAMSNAAEQFGHVTFETARELAVNNQPTQWTIQIQADRYGASTSYNLYFFMGDAPRDSSSWAVAANLVGSYTQLIPFGATHMFQAGVPYAVQHGAVSLTHTLAAGVARGLIDDLTPTSVVPLLTKYMTWKAKSLKGSVLDMDHIAGLKITVSSRAMQPISSRNQRPQYGSFEQHPSVTHNKAGGSKG